MFRRDYKFHDFLINDRGCVEVQISYVSGLFNIFELRTYVTLMYLDGTWVYKDSFESVKDYEMRTLATNFAVFMTKPNVE